MKTLAFAFFLSGGAAAFAASVTGFTSGLFSGPDQGANNTLDNGGTTIAFTGVSPMSCTYVPATACVLGSFTVTNNGLPSDFLAGDEFTLTVSQTSPGFEGSASTSVAISGPINSLLRRLP